MSRLIYENKLREDIDNIVIKEMKAHLGEDECGDTLLSVTTKIIKCIEQQPTAFDVDKVVEKIDNDINWYQFLKDNLKCNGTVITSDRGVITTKQEILQNVKDIIKAGGIDD